MATKNIWILKIKELINLGEKIPEICETVCLSAFSQKFLS